GGATMSFTPKVSSELRLNYSENRGSLNYELDDFGGAVVPADSILFPSGTSREKDVFSLFVVGALNTSLQVGTNAANLQRQFNAVGNLSVIADAHQIKVGVDYRRLNPVIRPPDRFIL